MTVAQLLTFLENCPRDANVRFMDARCTSEFEVWEMWRDKATGEPTITLEPKGTVR